MKALATIGLTNHYLTDVLQNKLKVADFVGVFSADTVPENVLQGSRRSICIVNTSGRLQPGTHFIVLLITRKRIELYDSLTLDLRLLFPQLMKHLTSSKKMVKFKFKRPLQNPFSAFCGFYCIYFCLLLSPKQYPDRAGQKKFRRKKLQYNNKILMSNIKKLIAANIIN